jgi:hypothetical protein
MPLKVTDDQEIKPLRMLRKFRENAAGALVVVHNILPTIHQTQKQGKEKK